MVGAGGAARLALVIALAAANFGMPTHGLAAEPAASGDMAVTVVKTQRLCFIDTLQVSGILVPRSEVLVRPDREGLQISQVLVEAGDSVVSGQVLARLTPPEGQPGGTLAVQAPAAGVVSSKFAIVGTTASARAEPLFRIAVKGEMELLAETPVKTLVRVAAGQSAKIEIIGIGEVQGNVRLFSPAINPTTQLGQVRLFVGNNSRLRVGAFGRAIIDIGRRCGPADSAVGSAVWIGGTVVQVVRDNRIETRRVTVGLIAGGEAEIRDGLSEGEMVVARAGAFVRDGDRIRPIEEASAR